MSGDRAYLSGWRTSDRPTADGASLAALGGRVRGQHRAPAAAARGGAAGHAAATAGSAQGRRQTGLGAGGVRIPALTYLFVFGADIDDFGVCVPGDPAGLRVIVRASALCNPSTCRRVAGRGAHEECRSFVGRAEYPLPTSAMIKRVGRAS